MNKNLPSVVVKLFHRKCLNMRIQLKTQLGQKTAQIGELPYRNSPLYPILKNLTKFFTGRSFADYEEGGETEQYSSFLQSAATDEVLPINF